MPDILVLKSLSVGEEAPAEIQIAPLGEYKDGFGRPFRLTEEDIAVIIQNSVKKVNDGVVDYEHQTLKGSEAPAAGWVKQLVNRGKDGLWGAVEWTAKARSTSRTGSTGTSPRCSWRTEKTGTVSTGPRSYVKKDEDIALDFTGCSPRLFGFNPRSRAGSDCINGKCYLPVRVSIHAPAQGATIRGYKAAAARQFQSTLPRRERRNTVQSAVRITSFNPRSRAGSDMLALFMDLPMAGFNPRSRAGSDIVFTIVGRDNFKFQSTLPRRERRSSSRRIVPRIEFQSTLPRRERRWA